MAPYLNNPCAFDQLLKPMRRLRLMSVCLGPFTHNPSSVQFEVKARDFLKENLFKPSKKPNFEKVVLEDKSSGVYYLLLIIVNQLVIAEDICLQVSSTSAKHIPPLNFRLWLNATYVEPTYQV